jgi:hypothetical protein
MKPHNFSHFLSFSFMSFSFPGFPQGKHTAIYLLCLLRLLLVVTASRTFLGFDDLDKLDKYWSDIS